MIQKEKIFITPFQEYRTLHIYVPNDINKHKPIAVMYMFDGHNLFFDEDATYHKSWGLKSYLDSQNKNLLVVGIECNHQGNERLSEFSPYSFSDTNFGNIEGRGKVLMQWLIKQLKPYIEHKFNIKSTKQNTYIAGSSMGGLMSVYAAIQYSRYFSKAICISPFLDYAIDDLKKELKQVKTIKGVQFYLSWGNHECITQDELAFTSERNLSLARILTSKSAQVYAHCFINGYHNEASWEKEIPIFIEELEI